MAAGWSRFIKNSVMTIQTNKITEFTHKLMVIVRPLFGKFNSCMELLNNLKLIKGIKTFFTLKLVSSVIFNVVSNVLDVVDFCLSVTDLF